MSCQAGWEAALTAMDPADDQAARRYKAVLEFLLALPETKEELAKLIDLRSVTANPTAVVDVPRLVLLGDPPQYIDEDTHLGTAPGHVVQYSHPPKEKDHCQLNLNYQTATL